MDMIGPNKTDTAKGDIYVTPATIEKLHQICMSIVATY